MPLNYYDPEGEPTAMKTIAILSDTHGLLRKELLTYLEQADVILHAGDIGAQTIVDTLAILCSHLCRPG